MKFALDLNTGSANLSDVNKIDVLVGLCTCTTWKNSAGSIGSQRHCAAGLAEVDAHLNPLLPEYQTDYPLFLHRWLVHIGRG